ncbi:MAG: hypothetical protein AAGF06_05695 [Pseudomonadota bacterium]
MNHDQNQNDSFSGGSDLYDATCAVVMLLAVVGGVAYWLWTL